MPRKKKEMGRPMERKYPPRIDATAEEIAHVVLNAGRPMGPVEAREYNCMDCGRAVYYPETLYRDGRCEGCRKAAV